MNRIIKKFVIFVLPFLFLFINVSYAEFTTSGIKYTIATDTNTKLNMSTEYAGYTLNQIISIFDNKNTSNETLELYEVMISTLDSAGYNLLYWQNNVNSKTEFAIWDKSQQNDIGTYVSSNDCYITSTVETDDKIVLVVFNRVVYEYRAYEHTFTSSGVFRVNYNDYSKNITGINASVKQLTLSSGYLLWDGESYYYKAPVTEGPDTPSLPSNAEIAQAVQAFYNSDYYKNNKDFKDFIVLYNTETQYFDFIGHTLGNTLGQVILPPNYRYQGKIYNQQWWKFYIDENQGAVSYGYPYYLYSTNDFGENITNEGVGKISELVGLDFSTKSVIVYSTTDYPVRTYVLNEESGDYTYTNGIIEGNQYTYDENLNPTENGYNPLDNFITVDPSQTIIGDADFEGLTNSFEEYKGLFSFTDNMQWLIVANNKLSNYFLGFIVMCALFITLSRVLKG